MEVQEEEEDGDVLHKKKTGTFYFGLPFNKGSLTDILGQVRTIMFHILKNRLGVVGWIPTLPLEIGLRQVRTSEDRSGQVMTGHIS